MKPIFVTSYSFEWIEPFNHSTTGKSMTVPDDAYSIEELFDRLDRGLSLGSPAPSVFDDEFESIDDYASSDLPEPDDFYDPSMRKIDRLTYVSEILDNDELSKKEHERSNNSKTRKGHSKDNSESDSGSEHDSGGEDKPGDQ